MLSDASVYSKHHRIQSYDTEVFIKSVLSKIDWSNETEDVVMDIGCGSGDNLRNILMPCLQKVSKVIAVDVLPSMISFAEKNNGHEKVDYCVANIADRSTLKRWIGNISKIISVDCLHWVPDQKTSFENMYFLLKPGCEAALTFVLTAPFWDTYETHISNPKWNKFLKDVDQHIPDSHFKQYGASHYKSLLEDIGFEVISCEVGRSDFSFPTDEECKGAIIAITTLIKHIPIELRDEFKEDFFQVHLKHYGRDEDGRPLFHYDTLTVHMRKDSKLIKD